VEAAAPSYQKAFTLNPGDPNVLVELGLLNAYAGNLAKSNEFFDQALRLFPLPPLWFADFRGVAEVSEGRYAQALPSFMAFPEAAAWDAMYAMACLGHLGKREQVAACKVRFQADGRKWDLLERAKVEPFIDSEPRQRLIAGLEIALAH
jgi:tetratricopeptide (TPR) repeat protein